MTRRAIGGIVALGLFGGGVWSAATSAERVKVRVEPRKVTLRLGEQRQFHASVQGTRDRTVRWSVEGAQEDVGWIAPSGVYTAPTSARTPAVIRVRATATDGETWDEAVVQIPAVRVHLSPQRLTMRLGRTMRFKARVEGAADDRVSWSLDGGPETGQINSSGLYTAPYGSSATSVTVRATSVADPTKSATATVNLADLSLSIRPREATVRLGEGRAFEAVVKGTGKTDVRWAVLEEGGGQISSTGRYRTPATMQTPATVTIIATSVADPEEKALAQVKIPAVSVKVSPDGAPRARKKQGRKIGATVYKVVRLTIPLDPLDSLVSFPFFRGRSGKVYVPVGGAYQLSARVEECANPAVHWSVDGGEENGSVTRDGLYHAPTRLTTPRVVQVRATSVADPTKSAVALLHIPPIVVEASPARVTTRMGEAVQLRASVSNSEEEGVLWRVEGGDANGTVSETGLYRPPRELTTPATVTVRAASAADPTKSAAIQVRVPAISVRLRPDTVTLGPGETARFRAEVEGSADHAVRWELQPPLGRISDDGLYFAPQSDTPGIVQVIATSAADPTKRATATVRLPGRH